MKLRLALLSHAATAREVTGAERSLLHLAGGLQALGHEVSWLSPEEGRSVDEARALGCRASVLPWPRLYLASDTASLAGTVLRAARFALGSPRLLALRQALAAARPDAALVNTLPNAGAAWAARTAGVPVLWRVAEIPGAGPRRRLLARAAARLPRALVAVSGAVAEALVPARAEVIPSGVAIPSPEAVAAARAELRHALALPPAAFVVGHVGQMRPHKCQLDLVTAAVGLAARGERAAGVVFALLGSAESDPAYARRLRAAGAPLGDRLRLPGFVAGAGRAAAALDVLAFTSRSPDPFPLVVLEAMAAGVPVVAYAAGGVPEAVVEGETGFLLPDGDTAGLALAIERLLLDRELRRRLGESARARVALRFTVERCVAAYAARLEEIARV